MSVVQETLGALERARSAHDAVVVAYSDGKDSRAVLDLCVRTFKRVEAFFMYLVPGLECVDQGLEWARRTYGIQIRQYPHWLLTKLLKQGTYCNATTKTDALPDWKLRDIYSLAAADAKCRIIATGAKRSDSRWRKWNLAQARYEDVLYPIVGWSKLDVLAYLKARKIPVPESSGRSATGIDLSTPSLLWLHDTFPEDFRRLCDVFPFAEAVIWRRHFYE